MAVKPFTDGLEAEDDAPIWRFVDFAKLQDLATTGELFFNRADRFPGDETEGIPPAEYLAAAHNLQALRIEDEIELGHRMAVLAQMRESWFISCWHLFVEETARLWQNYAEGGVALVSTYGRPMRELEKLPDDDEPHLGLVRYGTGHITRYNVQVFITTKREEFAHEREVRAALWKADACSGHNRHFDLRNFPHSRPLTPPDPARVPAFHRRRVDIGALIVEVVLNPKSSEAFRRRVGDLLAAAGHTVPVRESELAKYKSFLPY